MAPAAAPHHVPWTHWVVAARYVAALTVHYSPTGQLMSPAVAESDGMQPIAPFSQPLKRRACEASLRPARAAAPRHVPWTSWVVAARYVAALIVHYLSLIHI